MKNFLLFLCLFISQIRAQNVDTTLWSVNSGGQVNDMLRDGNVLYIGGTFTKVGQNTGCLASFGQSDAKKNANLPVITPGTIYTTVPDGNGGWFIGGAFTVVNGLTYSNIIHIKSDGQLNTAFNPTPNGAVRAIAIRNGRLYIAGSFSSVSSQSRANIAEIDIASGLVTSWNPGVNNQVNTMVLSGSKLYLGGTFTQVNSQNRARAACLDLTIGINTPWNPNITNGLVNSMVLHGARVYLGGTFTTVDGQTRNRIASVDTINGKVSGWDPGANNTVNSLFAAEKLIYAGGNFTSIGGFGLNRLAAIDTTTAAAAAWNPNADAAVNVVVKVGSFVYAGGVFNNIGGQPQSFLAKINEAGQQVAWNPAVNASVTALAVSGSSIVAGGTFNAAAEVLRNRLAAIDLSTGAATAWNPNANNTVNTLAHYQNTIIAGGTFTNIGGTAINRMAMIDKTAGTLNATWNPNANNAVNTVVISGQTLYAGGTFTNIGGQARSRLAAIDLQTGQATAFKPDPGNTVNEIILSGDNLFVGGAFTSIGGANRNRLAAVNVNSGAATGWNPNPNNQVYSLALAGKVIFAGGSFTTVAGVNRARLVAFDTSSTATAPKSLNLTVNDVVQSMIVSGTTLYLGGNFSNVGGQTRSRLAAIDTSGNGQLLPWNPVANDNVFVVKAHTECGNETIYAGGIFTSVKNIQRRGLAAISGVNQVNISRAVTNVTCNGLSNGAVTVSVTGGTPPYTYSKDNIDFQPTGNFTGLPSGNYTFYVKDNNNCVIQSKATVTEPSALSANETIFNETCAGQKNGAINLAPSGGKPPYTFNWSNGSTSQNITGLAGGAYTVIIDDASGCDKTQQFTVGSSPLPEAGFEFSFDQGVINFNNQSTGNPTSYAWNFGDNGSSNQTNPSHSFSAMGNYKVCLTAINDCGTDSACKIITVTNLNENNDWAYAISLMPNPAADFTIVESGINNGSPVYWNLTDLTGRVVKPLHVTQEKRFTIDLAGLSTGIYLLRMSRENGQQVTVRLVRN